MRIAVYFGSFDPIHKNHSKLCNDLLCRDIVDRIILVPNANNTLKPYLVSIDNRLKMATLGIQNEGLSDKVTVYHSTITKSNWDGRNQICKQIKTDHCPNGEHLQMFQLIGQDSFSKAIERCNTTHGIYTVDDRQFIIYPRYSPDPQKIVIPEELVDRCIVISDYHEESSCSSTTVRKKLQTETSWSEFSTYLHRAVFNYIIENHLYWYGNYHRFIVAIFGPPGSGKGTIAQKLSKKYSKYQHISTGEIYRQAKEQNNPEYQKLVDAKNKDYQVYSTALKSFILGQLKNIIKPGEYYLLDGLKPGDIYDFDKTIAPIDSIVILNCRYKVAEERLKKRQKELNREDDSDENIKRRLSNYYKYQWIQKEIINSYRGTGRPVHNINCENEPDKITTHWVWNNLIDSCKPHSKSYKGPYKGSHKYYN